jgi:hypothetical protein
MTVTTCYLAQITKSENELAFTLLGKLITPYQVIKKKWEKR